MKRPLVLVTGGSGQLGKTLQRHWNASSISASFELLAVDVEHIDITDSVDLLSYLEQLQPDWIINAAAYTHVDLAELHESEAVSVNASAVSTIANWCAETGNRLIQISTDFVFDGNTSRPYSPKSETAPLNVYGASKLEGERYVRQLLPHTGWVVRTSWLYSEYGSNFVKSMLRLCNELDEIKVIDDQVGSPTSTHTLTQFLFKIIRSSSAADVFHWTDGGEISWYDFAIEIRDQALNLGKINKDVSIIPISSAKYYSTATRPSYSVLNRDLSLSLLDREPENWKAALKVVLQSLPRPDHVDM